MNNKTVLTKGEKILITTIVLIFIPFFVGLFFYLSTGGRNLKAQYYGKAMSDKNGVLFIGDSLVEYCNFSRYDGTDNFINRGIAGLRSDELLNNIDSLLTNKQVDSIVILVGTNDIPVEKDNEVIAGRIVKIAKEAQNKTKAKVYVESLYPINKEAKKVSKFFVKNRTNERINEINESVRQKLEGTGIEYIDINSLIVDSKGNLREELSVDGLHVNVKAYKMILEKLIVRLNKRKTK